MYVCMYEFVNIDSLVILDVLEMHLLASITSANIYIYTLY